MDTQPLVLISQAKDGNMNISGEYGNPEILNNREVWLSSSSLTVGAATRLYVTYDRENYCQYIEVSEGDRGAGMRDGDIAPADALITRDKDHVLFLPIADCVAATIYDPVNSVLMLSHLGRHSLEQDGGYKSVMHLVNNYDSTASELQVWLSPAPSKSSYPIYKLNNKGMKEVVFEQFNRAGILPENIVDNSADTDTDSRYFSHTAFLKDLKPNDNRFAMAAVMLRK